MVVTAVIKARNEERQIADAVVSAFKLADRVLVVDDSSTDSTVQVAERAGADVVPGERHAGLIDRLDKQGMELVDSGWILRMDADERLTEQLASSLRQCMDVPGVVAVAFCRQNIMFGRAVRHGGWLRAERVGFFRADAWDRGWDCALHSQVPVSGGIRELAASCGSMIHHDYSSIPQFIERSLLRYATAEGSARVAGGERFRWRDLAWLPLRKFLGRALVRQGFRDGAVGIMLAALLGAYEFCVRAVMWDAQRKSSPASVGRDDGGNDEL